MITKIQAKGIKGLEIEQPLDRLNLVLGDNGTGKTARTDALTLAVLGYVPGIAKRNAEILDTYGDGKRLFVGFTTDDKTSFTRRFARLENGSVSQDYMIDRRKATKEQYAVALAKAGIKILDLKSFLDLSDQKKIDLLCSLFPPSGDLAELEEKIQNLKDRINTQQADIRNLDATRARLASSKAEMQLPPGTLAEIAGQIAEIEGQLTGARRYLEEARIEEAKAEAEAKAKREAEAKAAAERERIRAEVRAEAERSAQVAASTPDELVGFQKQVEPAKAAPPSHVRRPLDALSSIRLILSTMQRAGCDACAAALVGKRELRKLQEVA
jgi:hypothetical protein